MCTEEHSGDGPAKPSLSLICQVGPGPLSLSGPGGSLPVPPDDRVTLKMAMLYEGQCAGLGARAAAAKYGYTRQGYYKVLQQYRTQGAAAFFNRPGPKTNYRRSEEVVRAVIRYRFQHPESSTSELVSLLRAADHRVSKRSVERVISEYGLQQRDYPKQRARARRQTDRAPDHIAEAA